MRLITAIQIEGFRSIRKQRVEDIGPLTCLVGKNSTGKSNVLRALNLFFTGEVEPGKPINFARDHHETGARKKKRVSIEVAFHLPTSFKLRRELTALQAIGGTFSIKRTWELDQRRNPFDTLTISVDGVEQRDSGDLARQFLSLIHYRYVPVRGVPSALLMEESQAIADSIFLRMKGDKSAANLLKALSAAASRMLRGPTASLHGTGAPLSEPSLATTATLGEMLTMGGFQASGPHGGVVQDEDWGAGHQAFFLYLLLHTIDTDYGRFWGWRQATVWGIEEPESTLHRDLEAKLADLLRQWTRDTRSRLQMLQTTHSSVFSMASDAGYWVSVVDAETVVRREEIQKLIRTAATDGVSGWVQPALSFPWNPVVLVEGEIDVAALYHVATQAGFADLRFLTVPRLDPTDAARGKDGIIRYVRAHAQLIGNRPAGAPLVVLFDWDVSDQQLAQARTLYGDRAGDRVLRMDVAYCPRELGPDFRGIERFYPPRIVREAHAAGECVVGFADDQPYSISAAQLDTAKGPLLARLRSVTERADLRPLLGVLNDLQRSITGGKWGQVEIPL